MTRIFIDGDEKFNVGGLEDFEVTYAPNEAGAVELGSSNTLVAQGDLYNYFYGLFYDPVDLDAKSTIKIIQTCCDAEYTFNFIATYENLQLCDDCTINVTLSEDSDDRRCFEYMRNTLAYEPIKEQINWVKVPYCENILIDSLFAVYNIILFLPLFLFLEIIEAVVIGLCRSIAGFLFRFFKAAFTGKRVRCKDIDITGLDDFSELIGGCGWYHPAAKITDVIEIHAQQCGIEFESSILQQAPYNNMVRLDAQIRKGYYRGTIAGIIPLLNDNVDEGNGRYIEDNFPVATVSDILDSIAETIPCTKWEIIDGTLYFEKNEFFDNIKTETIDLREQSFEEPLCYDFNLQDACAYGEYAYTINALDLKGNESYTQYYEDIVEYNQDPVNDWQRGTCRTISPYGPVAFQQDKYVNCGGEKFRQNIGLGPLGWDRFSTFTHNLVLQNGRILTPKLIVLEPNYDPENAKAIKRITSSKGKIGCVQSRIPLRIYDYNYPLYYDAEYDIPELIQRFAGCKNPRGEERKVFDVGSATFAISCSEVASIVNTGAKYNLVGREDRLAEYSETIINFADGTITINGIKL